MVKIIGSRQQLLSLIVEKIVFVYIKRAVHEGPVENLGGFDPVIPDQTQPGWIVKVTTRTKRVVYVAVMVHPLNSHYSLHMLDEVDWSAWIGDKYDNEVFIGDNPEEYIALRSGD